MAFMNRGGMPSIGGDNLGSGGHFRGGIFYRRNYYIPLDNTYVIMQMIATFIILIVGAITFIATYKSPIIDPIDSTKKLFLNTHLISIIVILAITTLINFISKEKSDLLLRLFLTAIVSIIAMLMFSGVKLNLDNTYTENKFEQLYMEKNSTTQEDKKMRVSIGISGLSLNSEKEYYVAECVKLYSIFKIKSYGTLILHLLLNSLLVYQILKVQKIQDQNEKSNKDDLILFDEEENIKF